MKNKFFGIYYKYQSPIGDTFAVITSTSNEGDMVQIITSEGSFLVGEKSKVEVSLTQISLDVHEDGLEMRGNIECSNFMKPKKDIMSYYRALPIECKHQIYSMHHDLKGKVTLNGKEIDFDGGDGYIEGDKGRNFPNQYLWFNASNQQIAITLAIATIPLGLFSILGSTCLLRYQGKEYRFGTYNFARVKKISKDGVILKKSGYLLRILILDDNKGHRLKAPVKGDMVRHIHECPSLKARIILERKGAAILDVVHPYSSFEYVFDE